MCRYLNSWIISCFFSFFRLSKLFFCFCCTRWAISTLFFGNNPCFLLKSIPPVFHRNYSISNSCNELSPDTLFGQHCPAANNSKRRHVCTLLYGTSLYNPNQMQQRVCRHAHKTCFNEVASPCYKTNIVQPSISLFLFFLFCFVFKYLRGDFEQT